MGKWHIVIKKIKGRRYRYRQTTWIEDGRVRTRSQYLEPADGYAGAPWQKRQPAKAPAAQD
jgi:hypothetical protein